MAEGEGRMTPTDSSPSVREEVEKAVREYAEAHWAWKWGSREHGRDHASRPDPAEVADRILRILGSEQPARGPVEGSVPVSEPDNAWDVETWMLRLYRDRNRETGAVVLQFDDVTELLDVLGRVRKTLRSPTRETGVSEDTKRLDWLEKEGCFTVDKNTNGTITIEGGEFDEFTGRDLRAAIDKGRRVDARALSTGSAKEEA
jgi:hypothetical protein